MQEDIELLFKKENIKSHKNQGITVCNLLSAEEGVELSTAILYQIVDRKSVLYLSGGSTPKTLYTKLAKEEKLVPGAVGQVDERYGQPFHERSNQLMIRETGLTRYLEIRDIPFYPMLQGKDRVETSENYDQKIRELNAVFQRNIAILGIGTDGHTSGIPALNSKFTHSASSGQEIQNAKLYDDYHLVAEYNLEESFYKERVTMTFLGLAMQDILIILVFGEDKKDALKLMFDEGSEHEIPARFYKRPEIAKKTLLITDQSV
jgi:6-phosphogluconolactonase/glucosamine-6-phosphate isomerase/deaminase